MNKASVKSKFLSQGMIGAPSERISESTYLYALSAQPYGCAFFHTCTYVQQNFITGKIL